MEASAWVEEQFLKWILSTTAERCWELDECGQRIKLKAGWEKAQTEYNRISGLQGSTENNSKVWCGTCGIE